MSASAYRQIVLQEARPGLDQPIAVLACEPDDLERAYGVHFVTVEDDLDQVQLALIETRSGQQYALRRHVHSPHPGVEIVANEHAKDLVAETNVVSSALRLGGSRFRWLHPDIAGAGPWAEIVGTNVPSVVAPA